MVEPYRKWRLSYEAETVETTLDSLVARSAALHGNRHEGARRTKLAVEMELDMVVPCWVQDNSEAKIAALSEREQTDAKAMGIGFRPEQLFRGRGILTLDGTTRDFTCSGLRIRRRSYRPLGGFRGHCWQSAVFPNGNGFGYCTYPPSDDGTTYNDGYLFVDGRMVPSVAKTIPWCNRKLAEGEDVTVEMESELGITRISARSTLNVIKEFTFGPGTFQFNQGGAFYEWDGQQAFGMMERSYFESSVAELA